MKKDMRLLLVVIVLFTSFGLLKCSSTAGRHPVVDASVSDPDSVTDPDSAQFDGHPGVETKDNVEGETQVLLYGPNPAQFEYLAAMEGCELASEKCQCDTVRMCLLKDSKPADCSDMVPYASHPAALSALPDWQKLPLLAECYKTVMDPFSGQATLDGPRADGQTCKSGTATSKLPIYVLPLTSFGPTAEPPDPTLAEKYGKKTQAKLERWGAVSVETYDGRILLAGGAKMAGGCPDWSDPDCVDSPTSTVEVYDPSNGRFAEVGQMDLSGAFISSTMNKKRAFSAAVELPSGEIAIFGGMSPSGASMEPTNTVEVYNPLSRTFKTPEEVPSMTFARAYHTATLINSDGQGFVLLIGGFGEGEKKWEVWTPTMGSIASGELQEARWNHTATLINKDLDSKAREMVMITGGEGGGVPGAATVRSTVEIFDLANQAIQANMPFLCSNDGTKATPKTMHAAALVPARHFVYVAGGFKDGAHLNPARDICVWQTTKENWQGQAGAFLLEKGRGAMSATNLPDNAVLFAGGLIKNAGGVLEPATTVEIVFEYLNANGETVVDIGPDSGFPIAMLTPRWQHGAIRGCDGKVLFFGGLGGTPANATSLAETEVFNP